MSQPAENIPAFDLRKRLARRVVINGSQEVAPSNPTALTDPSKEAPLPSVIPQKRLAPRSAVPVTKRPREGGREPLAVKLRRPPKHLRTRVRGIGAGGRPY